MTNVPANPPATNTQRNGRMVSFSMRAANSVMTNGDNKAMAVNSPTGMYLRLKKAKMLQANSKLPRAS